LGHGTAGDKAISAKPGGHLGVSRRGYAGGKAFRQEKESGMRRWLLGMVAGVLLTSGCVVHHGYRSEAPGHYKGYYLSDGTYVKVHPKKGYVQGYVLKNGRHVKVHPKKGKKH
jgi:hypothetical protein